RTEEEQAQARWAARPSWVSARAAGSREGRRVRRALSDRVRKLLGEVIADARFAAASLPAHRGAPDRAAHDGVSAAGGPVLGRLPDAGGVRREDHPGVAIRTEADEHL